MQITWEIWTTLTEFLNNLIINLTYWFITTYIRRWNYNTVCNLHADHIYFGGKIINSRKILWIDRSHGSTEHIHNIRWVSLIISMNQIYLKQKYSNEGKAKITVALEGRTKSPRRTNWNWLELWIEFNVPRSIIRSYSNTFRGLV